MTPQPTPLPAPTKARRLHGLFSAHHHTGRAFFFGSFSACRRLAGTTGSVRPADENARAAIARALLAKEAK